MAGPRSACRVMAESMALSGKICWLRRRDANPRWHIAAFKITYLDFATNHAHMKIANRRLRRKSTR
jgi:hypothetical protein